jgi:Flp pilus assembly protein TadG
MPRPRSRRACQNGSSTVEFALVLPLLFVVSLALIQVALLGRDQLLVEAAARAGARAAAVADDQTAVVGAALRAAPTLDPAATTVSTTREGARGSSVTVDVRFDDRIRVPFVDWLVGDAVELHATAVMRQEFG